MTPGSPVAGSASAAVPNTSMLTTGAAQGADAGQGDPVQQMAGQLREIKGMVDELGSTYPAVANEVTQINNLLRQMIVKQAQAASTQTPSALALPAGAGGQ